ncbi:MAG: polyprenyl synthetase family protein [Candidatus Kariarchaeaceae archaeon]|jgi:geranylgeranyl diphosphate synthase type I
MDLRAAIEQRGRKAIEHLITQSETLINPPDPLREAALHYLTAGGKGMRPAMLQLVCGALNGKEENAIPAAAAIEAMHVSSLIHDDFMDRDEVRRGVPSVWVKWNPTIAILAGDALLAVAMAIVGEISSLTYELRYAINKELAMIYTKLCEGQMYDIGFETRDIQNISVEDVKNMQYLKTGVLFEFACITGARIALNKLKDPLINCIREYARLAGTAFQIQDDIIGLIGDEEAIGKPVGSDIRVGKRTLISTHALTHASDAQKKIILTAFENKNATTQEVTACINMIEAIGSITHARDIAEKMAIQAREVTKQLPDNEQTRLLAEFASYMVQRKL